MNLRSVFAKCYKIYRDAKLEIRDLQSQAEDCEEKDKVNFILKFLEENLACTEGMLLNKIVTNDERGEGFCSQCLEYSGVLEPIFSSEKTVSSEPSHKYLNVCVYHHDDMVEGNTFSSTISK